jgi:hypothetical protein
MLNLAMTPAPSILSDGRHAPYALEVRAQQQACSTPENHEAKILVISPDIPVSLAAERTSRSPDRHKVLAYFDEIPPISPRDS